MTNQHSITPPPELVQQMTDTFRNLCAEHLPELRGMFERILCVARSSDGFAVGNIQLADRLINAVVSWSENSLAQPEPVTPKPVTPTDEALEAAQPKVRSGPESPLVERVADAIAAQATSAGIVNDRPARAAILEVAAWLREKGYGSWVTLQREANQ